MTILNQEESYAISSQTRIGATFAFTPSRSIDNPLSSPVTVSNPFRKISSTRVVDREKTSSGLFGISIDTDLLSTYEIQPHVITYNNLKPFTKYRLFNDVENQVSTESFHVTWRTNPASVTAYEITKFYVPKGDSRQYNTHASTNFPYFVSDGNGVLVIESIPGQRFDVLSENYTGGNAYVVSVPYEPKTKPTNKFRLLSVGEASQFVTPVDNSENDDDGGIVIIDTSSGSGAGSGGGENIDPGTEIGGGDEDDSGSGTLDTLNSKPGYIQSFYVDPARFFQEKTVDLTGINLYFRRKPEVSDSGVNQNVLVYMIPMNGDQPDLTRKFTKSLSFQNVSAINTSTNADIPTYFAFQTPVRIETGKFYAFAVEVYDEQYLLWSSKVGHTLVGTNAPSPGSSQDHKGELYELSNATQDGSSSSLDFVSTPKYDEDLKFDIFAAEYTIEGDVVVNLVNKEYEFLSLVRDIDNPVLFSKTEMVYQETANSVGTVSTTPGSSTVIGNGTNFEDLLESDRIIIIDASNTQIKEMVTVASVVSNTELNLTEPPLNNFTDAVYQNPPTGRVYQHFPGSSELFLEDSDATASSYFQANGVLRSITTNQTARIEKINVFPVSSFEASFGSRIPSSYNVSAVCNFGYDETGTYKISDDTTYQKRVDLTGVNYMDAYESVILSRSLEVLNPAFLYDNENITASTGAKSTHFQFTFSHAEQNTITTTYEAPELNLSSLKLLFTNYFIDNNTDEPKTRHVSTPLVLDKGKLAEDIRVIYNAYIPAGTSIKCFAKIMNSSDPASFEDKPWTELELIGAPQISSKDDRNDFRELQYTFPSFPVTEKTLDGTVDTETLNANNIVTGVGTTFSSDIVAGDVIKIHNPLFDENYGLFHVESVDSDTQITLSERVTNNGIIDTTLKIDTLVNDRSAYINVGNKNIVRYFDADGVPYDGYTMVAIKTEMYAESRNVVPRLNDYRVIAVSA